MPLPTSRIPGFTVALPMARHHRGSALKENFLPRQGGGALWLLLLVGGKKKGERGVLIRQYWPNITTNHIQITQIYQYIECVFQCSCFDYHSFITPVRSQVVLFGAGKMLRGLFKCDLVRYVSEAKDEISIESNMSVCRCSIAETAGKWVSKCPQRSVLGATCFCSWFPLPAHEYAKKCVKYIVKSK